LYIKNSESLLWVSPVTRLALASRDRKADAVPLLWFVGNKSSRPQGGYFNQQ